MRFNFGMPTGSSASDKLRRVGIVPKLQLPIGPPTNMVHFFDMGYADGLYFKYRGESVNRTVMNPAQTEAYNNGFDKGRNDLKNGELD